MVRLRSLMLCCGILAHTTAFSSLQYAVLPHVGETGYGRNANGSLLTLSAGGMLELDDSNYKEVLLERNDKAVLVDACAEFCGPCKLIVPVLDKCAKKWSETLELVKFDVESESTNLKMELLMQNVRFGSLPSLVLFKNGKAIASHTGVITEEELDSFLEMNLRVSRPKKKSGAGFVSFARDAGDDYMLSGS